MKQCNDRPGVVTVIFIILICGFLSQYKFINTLPLNIHAWAQTDRYALALGFLDNGLDFFQPQTYVFNKQFPDNYESPAEQTITAIDFPIHDYVPALFMKISGDSSPWIFRCYILFYSLIGLYHLYKLAYSLTINKLKSIFIVFFAATSPVFVYYQGGFLPTIPSLSNAIIGLYFYSKYLSDSKKNNFAITIFFLTLATLARTTFAIPLIAIYCLEFVRILKKESILFPKILPIVLSTVLLMGYQLYNSHLRGLHGSMFLNYILPPSSFTDAKEIIYDTYKNWAFNYFTAFQYIILLIVGALAIFFLFFKKEVMTGKTRNWVFLIGIYLFGCLVFSTLMLQQFVNHDYYFLDTFFLPITMLLITFFTLLPQFKNTISRVVFSVGLVVVFTIMVMEVMDSQEKRHKQESWNKVQEMNRSFENADTFLDSLHISRDAKILTFNSFAPNIPFIKMRRKGFVVVRVNSSNIKNALSWDYDYIVFDRAVFFSDLAPQFPIFLKHVIKVAENDRLLVCKYSKVAVNQKLVDFMGFKNKQVVFERGSRCRKTMERSYFTISAFSSYL